MTKTAQASSSVVELTCPRSWREVPEEMLPRLLRLVHLCPTPERLVLRSLCLFTGIKVVRQVPGGWLCRLRRRRFFLRTWQFMSMARQLEWLDTTDGIPVRMGCIGKARCVCGLQLHGLPFGNYLACEQQYQLFLLHRNVRFLKKLTSILYPIDHLPWWRRRLHRLQPWHLTATFLWFQNCKQVFSKEFPWFFRPAADQADDSFDLISQYNMQVRALTGGDITKESTILSMDCWRALTELNAKAHEGEQHRQEMQRIRNRQS